MELNSIFFPAPPPSYDSQSFKSSMVWLPNVPGRAPIPCLYLRCHKGSSKVLVYFHGNAEDVGLAQGLMDHLRTTLAVHVLAVEYPGYGIYPGQPSAERLVQDADLVFGYLTTSGGLESRDILVFGRSIGTGPATWLASERRPGALVLMSGYTSIRSVVRNLVGSFGQYFVAERFNNLSLMPKVACPTLLVHGQRDTLIPFQNSQALHEVCGGPCSLLLPKDMDHNMFDFYADLSIPLASYLDQCGVSVKRKRGKVDFPFFAEGLFEAPNHPREILPKGRWTKLYSLFS